jgi:hypothetical protein
MAQMGEHNPSAPPMGERQDERAAELPHAMSKEQPVERPLGPAMPAVTACPMHSVMRRLAEAVVLQHVLYAEGEVLPRPNLTGAIAEWAQLHTLIQRRICPASRQTVLTPTELEVALGAIFAALPDSARLPHADRLPHAERQLRRALGVCAAQSQAEGCPLDRAPDERLLGAHGVTA